MAVASRIHGSSVSHETLALFLQEIIVEYASYRQNIRRSEDREPVSIPVQARQLTPELQPVGEPFHMVTRDISCHGVGLFHLENVEPGPIQLTFSSPVSGAEINLIASVEHCTPCGHYFIIGCRFSPDL